MKIFTDTSKWQAEWFITLPPLQKLGFLYLMETSDPAGVFEKPGWVADMAISGPDGNGHKVDWDKLVESDHIVELPNGKYWLKNYIELQCPNGVTESSKGQSKIRDSIAKNNLPIEVAKGIGRVSEGYSKGISKSSDSLPKGIERLPEEEEEEEEDKIKTKTLVPYRKIVDMYHEILPTLPKVERLNEGRKKAMNARWKEYDQDLSQFERVFEHTAASEFHSGKSGQWNGCDFNWLMNPTNFLKMLERVPANTLQEPQPPELFEPVGWQEAARKYPEDTQQRIFGNGATWENVPEELKGYLLSLIHI